MKNPYGEKYLGDSKGLSIKDAVMPNLTQDARTVERNAESLKHYIATGDSVSALACAHDILLGARRLAAHVEGSGEQWDAVWSAFGATEFEDLHPRLSIDHLKRLFDMFVRHAAAPAPAESVSVPLDEMVKRFLGWVLPSSVCADQCATQQNYPFRSGTNLLTAIEARQMLEHVFAAIDPDPAPSAWISVKERLPEVEVDVLTWDGRSVRADWIGSKPDFGRGVTHWQPLPAPPAASEEGEPT